MPDQVNDVYVPYKSMAELVDGLEKLVAEYRAKQNAESTRDSYYYQTGAFAGGISYALHKLKELALSTRNEVLEEVANMLDAESNWAAEAARQAESKQMLEESAELWHVSEAYDKAVAKIRAMKGTK